ncbi:MAG: hypothetical protein EBX60_10640 [Betaproteobacteria bacterium]|nr:hypothetical protein [Betaproteobacteria bacterium]
MVKAAQRIAQLPHKNTLMKSQSSIVYKSIKTMNPLKTRKLAPAPLLAVALGASSLLYGSQAVAMDLLLNHIESCAFKIHHVKHSTKAKASVL